MIVIGARCAGAATAMLLARAGVSVLVLDRGQEGTDTLSTHALMRAGVLQLHRWGILDALRRRETPVVRSTSFHYDDDSLAIALKPRDGVEGLFAPRRFVLDQALVTAAREAGADLVFGVTVTGLLRAGDGRVTGVIVKDHDNHTIEISAKLVIGADGMRSTVAQLVEATQYKTAQHTTAVIFNYFSDIGLDGYHWYYRAGISAGAIPTNDGMTCVFVSIPPSRFHAELAADVAAGHAKVARERDGDLADRIAGAGRHERYRGFAGLHGYFRQPWGPGWALVGDAGYFKDPLTAHGMTDALVDAEHLARAVIAGTDDALSVYQHSRDERSLAFFELTDAIASFSWDVPTLKGLHRKLSEEMKREADGVLQL
ncbi:MAG: NAD(P)/FAD-dependent oxidoreductase [Kofleriaceae bacterium]